MIRIDRERHVRKLLGLWLGLGVRVRIRVRVAIYRERHTRTGLRSGLVLGREVRKDEGNYKRHEEA